MVEATLAEATYEALEDSGTATVKREDGLIAANLTSWPPRNGDIVRITGLQKADRYNGMQGRVTQTRNKETNRCVVNVQLGGNEINLAIRLENLTKVKRKDGLAVKRAGALGADALAGTIPERATEADTDAATKAGTIPERAAEADADAATKVKRADALVAYSGEENAGSDVECDSDVSGDLSNVCNGHNQDGGRSGNVGGTDDDIDISYESCCGYAS